MLISWREVRELEDLIQKTEDTFHLDDESQLDLVGATILNFINRRPHLIMPIGFDEYVGFKRKSQYQHLWFANHLGISTHFLKRVRGKSIFRQPSGQWLLFTGPPVGRDSEFCFDDKAHALGEEDGFALEASVQDLFRALYRCATDETPTSEERIWSPSLWTPDTQEKQRLALADTTSKILKSIQAQKATLQDLSWRTLEELVAEILRRSGLDIYVVRDRPQGGRDIIARGELIAGQEPIQIAVEVKHKAVVERPEVQTALWQNRRYPALLFVTSGRFTSGVLQEAKLPENRLRLFLKDGVALGDLIRDYPFR